MYSVKKINIYLLCIHKSYLTASTSNSFCGGLLFFFLFSTSYKYMYINKK